MKKTMMILALSAGVIFAGCGSKQTEEAATETPAEKPAEQQAEQQAEQPVVINTTHAYICPMNCEGSPSMEAGNCIKCGMALVENPDYIPADTAAAATAATAEDAHDHEDHEGHNH